MVVHKFRTGHKVHEYNEEERYNSSITVKNWKRTYLFIIPLYEFKLNIDNDSIIKECFDLKNQNPKGVKKSNWADGWQSDVYDFLTIGKNTTPAIQNLAKEVIELSKDMVENYGGDNDKLPDESIGWWININKGMGYNVVHTHPGCSIIGIYYPQIPKNLKLGEGQLCFIRADATSHNNIFADIKDNCDVFLTPKEKSLYLLPSTVAHYVTPHFSDEERISIAFNIG